MPSSASERPPSREAPRPGAGVLPVPERSHPFRVGFPEARRIQERLRGLVVVDDALGPVRTVAGVDVSHRRGSAVLHAAVVVLDLRTGERLEVAHGCAPADFPYVPGYLSFREIPALLDAFARLSAAPDLIVCDGHGRAHPRRFGLACHLGVLLDLPAVGCAKSLLIGSYQEPGARRGCHRRILDGGEVIGEAVRTRDGVAPVFVSVGHRVRLETARRLVLRLARGTRLPETTRQAHREVNRLRRELEPPRGRFAPAGFAGG